MCENFSKEQIRAARRVDLYDFLKKHHGFEFNQEGCKTVSLRPKNNHSISIRKGFASYKDFATGETGNSLDFLVLHMGYEFKDAVQALLTECGTASPAPPSTMQQNALENVPPEFPAPVNGKYRNLFAYLESRGISMETIQKLVDEKIIYQENSRNNIVFINRERDFAELRGTYTYGKPFHGVIANCRHDGFWWFRTSKHARTAYICEAAIDAISLYELHRKQKNPEAACYISIAGVTKQPAIDRVKNSRFTPVIAVDNDDAGQKCRERNPDLNYILPVNKDWNEDLQAFLKK